MTHLQELRCFLLYVLYGSLGFILELMVLAVLLQTKLYYLFSVLLAWLVGMTVHFLLSDRSAFVHDNPRDKTYPTFFIISGVSVIAGIAFIYVLVEYLMLPVLIARIISAVVIGLIVFVIHRLHTFS